MEPMTSQTPAGYYSRASLFHSPAPRWRVATAAAIHTNQIIVNEKSLRGIMLSTGSLFISPHRHWDLYGGPECFLWVLVFRICCLETNKGGKSSTVLAKMGRRLALHNNARFVKRRWNKLMTLVEQNINGLLHGIIWHGMRCEWEEGGL